MFACTDLKQGNDELRIPTLDGLIFSGKANKRDASENERSKGKTGPPETEKLTAMGGVSSTRSKTLFSSFHIKVCIAVAGVVVSRPCN